MSIATPKKPKEVICLGCQVKFPERYAFNRFCLRCTARNKDRENKQSIRPMYSTRASLGDA